MTLTLDLLLTRGELIDQVVVLYLASNARYQQAFQRLAGEFAGDHYQGRRCRLRAIPIRLANSDLAEVHTSLETDAVWQAFHQLMASLKAEAQQIHLSLTGGPRILSLLAMSTAMLHFTTADRAWHIYTPPEITEQLKTNGALHAAPDAGVHLIEVSLVPWATLFPGLREVLGRSPLQIMEERLGWLDEIDRRRCQQVWDGLSLRKRDTLKALCQKDSRELAAEFLGVEVSTIDTHKTDIFRLCRDAWGLEKNPDLIFLRKHFKPFLAGNGELG